MRYVITALALLVVVGGLATVKFKQISSLMAMGKQMEKVGPPPESVGSAPAQTQTWGGTISAVGTIASVKGVAISNEVPGTVSAIHFESGASVKEGQVLVELDSRVERSQLAAIEARGELARLNAGRTRALVDSNSIAKAQLDTDESVLKTSRADLDALKVQIARKVVHAPFTGRLGIRQVNLGQYLSPGTTITALESINSVFVDFTLPQQQLEAVKVGMPVRVEIEGASGTPQEGTIAAIEPSVDATTRTLKARAQVKNEGERLRPGMFAKVSVVLPEQDSVVAVPVASLVHASYGDSVFIVEDKSDDKGAPVAAEGGKTPKVARQQFVRVGEARGDFVAITDGVKPGQEVVTAGAFKLRNGAGVVINNDVKADYQLSPTPQNR